MTVVAVDPVLESIVVEVPVERAFEVFTTDLTAWWPASHHIGEAPFTEAIFEPHVGGRWFERDAQGGECVWGRVLDWEPPHRLVVSWSITPDFRPEPDPDRASEVEVRFVDLGDGTTRVDLAHRHFERHGEGAGAMRAGVSSSNGWAGLLVLYASRTAVS